MQPEDGKKIYENNFAVAFETFFIKYSILFASSGVL